MAFIVHRAGSGRQDRYDDDTHFWTVEAGGTIVVWKRSEREAAAKVAAYAPTWWFLVATEEDE